MAKEHLNPASLFPSLPLGFSQIVTARGGKTLYISGQTAWDADKQIVGGSELGEQTRQALRNIQTAVETAGGDHVGCRFVADLRRELQARGCRHNRQSHHAISSRPTTRPPAR